MDRTFEVNSFRHFFQQAEQRPSLGLLFGVCELRRVNPGAALLLDAFGDGAKFFVGFGPLLLGGEVRKSRTRSSFAAMKRMAMLISG